MEVIIFIIGFAAFYWLDSKIIEMKIDDYIRKRDGRKRD